MSRTDNTVPYRVAADRSPGKEDWHNGCDLDPEQRKRRRVETTTIEHPAQWRLVTESFDRSTETWTRYVPEEPRYNWRMDRNILSTPRLRERWVFEAWTETIEQVFYEVVECDIDTPGGKCRRFGGIVGNKFGHRTYAYKEAHNEATKGSVRVRERDHLKALADEYNATGDLDDDDFDGRPSNLGWW